MQKEAINTENLQEMDWFNWGVRIKDVNEVFYVTGTCDMTSPGHEMKYPGDPVGQAKQIFIYMEEIFTKAGYTKQDIVYVDWAVTKDVTHEQAFEILKLWEAYVSDLDMKPAAGIWKHVYSLIHPEMMVEFELTLAR